jgi:hypothetical protein
VLLVRERRGMSGCRGTGVGGFAGSGAWRLRLRACAHAEARRRLGKGAARQAGQAAAR